MPKKYLDMMRPRLSDMTDDHKTHGKLKVHSGNKLKMKINNKK